MAYDRFDFEQDIYECWHVMNDIQQLYKMASDKDRRASTEDIANVLLGMKTLYDDRFYRLMDNFEQLIINDHLPEDKSYVSSPGVYEKMYSELLTKLRLISEKDMFTNSPVQKLLAEIG